MRKSQVTTINLNNAIPNPPVPYRLSEFVVVYIAALAALTALRFVEPLSLILAYPIVATVISRFFSKRVIWWNQADSIENLFAAKFRFWLFWPYEVPRFIVKVAVARYL
jgi:hypothetical protein